jgi:hypothetical protein
MPGAARQGRECGMKIIDLTGKRFGRLLVISRAANRGAQVVWLCRCDCGVEKEARGNNLLSGCTTSCGCASRELITVRNTTHGMTYSHEYAVWCWMLDRCRRPGNSHYEDYGGRGISVCERWANSFEAFYQDMGARPAGLTLERINNDGNYEPGNCKWATLVEQRANRRKQGCGACARRTLARRAKAQEQRPTA